MGAVYWFFVLVIASVFFAFGLLAGFGWLAFIAYPIIYFLAGIIISDKDNYDGPSYWDGA